MAMKLSTGLVQAMQGNLPVVSDSGLTGSNLAFVDNGASPDSMTDSGSGFIADAQLIVGDYIVMTGATTEANDDMYGPLLSVAAGTITFATGQVDTAEAGAAGTKMWVARGGSFKDVMRYGVLYIYSGSQPDDADSTESGTLLAIISLDGSTFTPGTGTNGLTYDDPVAGVADKPAADTWKGQITTGGVAGWFRFYDNARTQAASTTACRFDGAIGTTGKELNLAATTLVLNRYLTIDELPVTLPTAA